MDKMIRMLHWQLFQLEDNPFGLVPRPEKRIWADHKKFKEEIETVIKFALMSSPSKIIACVFGDWGIGKTHATNYFSHKETLKELAEDIGEKKRALSVRTIFPARDTVDTLYLDIISVIIQEIKNASKTIEKSKLKEIVKDDTLTKIIFAKSDVMERYLFLAAKASDLKELGVARPIETLSEKLKVLRGMFNLLSNTLYSRIILWMDDAERIENVSSRDLFELQVFLRDLLDYVPQNLNIIMNITLTPGRKVDDVLRFLGPPIISRFYKMIMVEELSKEDFFRYVEDCIRFYRIPKVKTEDPYFPFKREALEFVYNGMKERKTSCLPRTINIILSRTLELALTNKQKVVDVSFVKNNAEEIFLELPSK